MMIYESYPYFEKLDEYVQKHGDFNIGKYQEDRVEEYLCELERDTFFAAFILRKLIENLKIADSYKEQKMELVRYASTSSLNNFNVFDIAKAYDLSRNSEQKETKDIGFICNQLIHSKVFVFAGNFIESELSEIEGFFINSDYTASKKLYYVFWKGWINLVNSAKDFHVDFFHSLRNEDGALIEYRFSSKKDADNEVYKSIAGNIS